jgi:YgiT-type zinc finger domain-containing protein
MNATDESLVERRVRYTVEYGGKLYVVENVPARVNEETGEQFFAPSTVECLQRTVLDGRKPNRIIETPVYEYYTMK